MAFQDEYSRPVTHEDSVQANLRKTILPFFGFELYEDSESYIDTYGGNTYVTKVGVDTYKVSQSATGLYSRTKHYHKWRRKKPVFTDYELETKVQKWLKKNKFNDIWMTPYICPSVEDFHQMYGYGPKNGHFRNTIIALLIIGVILTAAIAIAFAGGSIFSALPEFLQDFILPICAMPFISCSQIAALLLLLKYLHNKKYRTQPLKDRDQKYQNTLRQQYYSGLVNLFGEEIGNSMINLSIQREQAQK